MATGSLGVQPDDGCGQGDGGSGDEPAAEIRWQAGPLVAPCSVWHSQPCGENHPESHDQFKCSFVPPSDLVIIIDSPLVAFVTDEHDPMMNGANSFASRGRQERSDIGAQGARAHCASLCTWLI